MYGPRHCQPPPPFSPCTGLACKRQRALSCLCKSCIRAMLVVGIRPVEHERSLPADSIADLPSLSVCLSDARLTITNDGHHVLRPYHPGASQTSRHCLLLKPMPNSTGCPGDFSQLVIAVLHTSCGEGRRYGIGEAKLAIKKMNHVVLPSHGNISGRHSNTIL